MKQVLLALAPAAILFATGAVAQGAPAQSDSIRLQGSWRMIAGTANGTEMPANYVQSMRRVLTGTTLTVTIGGQTFFEATIELKSGEHPKAIDYHMTAGPTKGAIQRGIYRLAGDTVVFCFAGAGAARPAEFVSTPGDGRTLSTWVPARP